MEQAVDTSSSLNQTEAMREGISRMKTWATQQTTWPSTVTRKRCGCRLPNFTQAPRQLRVEPERAMVRRSNFSKSQATAGAEGCRSACST